MMENVTRCSGCGGWLYANRVCATCLILKSGK